MPTVYRIIRQKYSDRPLDVMGTWLNGGRWNPPGIGILYTAEHPALALVEIFVHMPQVPYDELPTYRLFQLEIPDNNQRLLELTQLPEYWAEPTYTRSQTILSDWLIHPDVLALGVPSAIMPESVNYLLHPAHPAYAQLQVIKEMPLLVDPRLWKR